MPYITVVSACERLRAMQSLDQMSNASLFTHKMICKFIDTDTCTSFKANYLEEERQLEVAKKTGEMPQTPFTSLSIIVNKLTGDTASTGKLFNNISLYPNKSMMIYDYTPYDMAIYGSTGRGTIQRRLERARKGEVKVSDVSTRQNMAYLTLTESANNLTQISKWILDQDKNYSPVRINLTIVKDGKVQSERTVLLEEYHQEAEGLWFPRRITRYHKRLDGLWGVDIAIYTSITPAGPEACSMIQLDVPSGKALYLSDVPFSTIHPDKPTVINVENLHDYITQCQAVAEASAWARRGFFDKYRYVLLVILLMLGIGGAWFIYQRETKPLARLDTPH